MSEKLQAFALVNYKFLNDDEISLNGYVLTQINVGDSLILYYENNKYFYIIDQIIAYKEKFQHIEQGMSAEIIVHGPHINLNSSVVFYIQ